MCVCAFDGFLLQFLVVYTCLTTASPCNDVAHSRTVVLYDAFMSSLFHWYPAWCQACMGSHADAAGKASSALR